MIIRAHKRRYQVFGPAGDGIGGALGLSKADIGHSIDKDTDIAKEPALLRVLCYTMTSS